MGNLDLFGPNVLRAGITPVVVTSASVHSLSQDFSLPGEAEGPDLGWHMGWTGRRSTRDAQGLQEVEDELVIACRQIYSIDHQLYAHDLQLKRGHDVRVVPLPPGGGARMRQLGSGLQTRGGSTSRRGRAIGDDSKYNTLLSTPQPQMSSSSSDSSIPDPPGLPSSSSDDDLISNCEVAICVLHQAAVSIVVKDATSSYGGSVMGCKNKRKK
ncbi:hypothetical protein GIB67_012689 [Kingdonia uniflora]|uniref:Uncharacterized protein n=1 Tax=Kingdonia uniflora TaxID=39325 RepID=A0A7J7NFM6_9MAGN|nr:hypothetical protein GIB67_012689 [Kingdonia uniflora]